MTTHRETEIQQLRASEDELERQNAELLSLSAALEAERRRYQLLFDRAPLAHLTTDVRGRIVEANEAAGRMLEVEPRFLAGKPIATFVTAADRRRFRTWLLHPAEEAPSVFRLQRRLHVPFDAEVRVFLDEGALGWIIRDVTSELQAERQIWELNRELEQRVAEQAGEMTTVYDQLPVGVAIVHAAGRDTRLNRRGRQLIGDEFPFDEQVEQALQGEEVRAATVRLAKAGQSELVLGVTAGPLRGPKAEVTGAVLTFDDVTERARIDRADRDFVTNASHQLRTPITSITTAVAALKAGAGGDAAERDRFLDHLETEAERLARITDAMLVLSRAQRRNLDAPLTLVRVRPILERLLSEVTPADGVVVELTCDEAVAVIAHAALLEEAVASVLANAAEHTRTGVISVAAYASGETAEIEIADTGPGMEPEIRERAFERFFGSTATRRSAGLGLAIAAAAVQASLGRIELASEPGVGTRVRILLPGAPLLQS